MLQPEGGLETIQKSLIYPDEARRRGVEAKVVLNVGLNEQGLVKNVKIIESTFDKKTGDYGCHQAAIDAVKKSRWIKSSLAKFGKAEGKFSLTLPVVFTLKKDSQDKKTIKISGTVTDKKTGKSLEAVDIILEGTGRGMPTDVEGKYYLAVKEEGNYVLKASRMGYKTITINNVKTVSGKTKIINIELEPVIVKIQDIKRIKILHAVKVRTKIEPDPDVKIDKKIDIKIDPIIDIKIDPDIDVKVDQKIDIKDEPVYVPFSSPPEPIGGFEEVQNTVRALQAIKESGGKGGRVVFQVFVNENGESKKVKIVSSTASKEEEKTALQVIKSVKWKPAKQRDKAVAVWVEVPIEFNTKRKVIK